MNNDKTKNPFEIQSVESQRLDFFTKNATNNNERDTFGSHLPKTMDLAVHNGKFYTGLTNAHFAAMRILDEEATNTRELRKGELVGGGQAASAASSMESNMNAQISRRIEEQTFGQVFTSDESRKTELNEIGYFAPGQSVGGGQDIGLTTDLGLSPLYIALRELDADTTTTEQLSMLLGTIMDPINGDATAREGVLTRLVEMNAVPEQMVKEARQSGNYDTVMAVAVTPTNTTQAAIGRVDELDFPQLAQEATAAGLDSPVARGFFILEEFQKGFSRAASKFFTGQMSQEDFAKILLQGTKVYGADFVEESMAFQHQHSFTLPSGEKRPGFSLRSEEGRKAAYDSLDDDFKAGLEALGLDHNRIGSSAAHLGNEFSYKMYVKNILLSAASTNMREVAYETEMHDGLSYATRAITDMATIDFANDPTSVFMTIPTIAGGFGASALAGGVVKQGLSKTMLYTAMDGLMAGAAEGYAMSISEDLSAFQAGKTGVTVDYSQVMVDAALYGSMGMAFGGLLPGLFAGVGAGAGKLKSPASAMLTGVRNTIDDVAGVAGVETAGMANRSAVRSASSAELERAQEYSLLHPGAVIRLFRGEIEALDVVGQSLRSMTRKGDEGLEALEALFDTDGLARMGVSPLEVADLVLAIQNKLGPGQTIGADQLMGIVKKYAKKADRATRYAGIAGESSLERRMNLTLGALAQTGKRAAARFVGGRGLVSLTDAEAAKFVVSLKSLADGDTFTPDQIRVFMERVLRLNDMDVQDRAADLIRKRFGNDVDLTQFEQTLNGVRSQSKAARKDKYLRKILRAEHAMDILDNERTIKIASRLGVSSKKLRAYVREMKGAIGDEKLVADVDARYQGAREAIEAINAEGLEAFKFLDAPESYNTRRFIEEDDSVEAIRELDENLRALTRETNDARAKFQEKGQKKLLADKLQEIKEKYAPELQRLSKSLGLELDQSQAMERVVAKMDGTLPFKLMSELQQGKVMAEGITRAIDNVSTDKISSGLAARDRGFIDMAFEGTGLGERFRNMWTKMAMWGSTGAQLTRNNNRLIRGISQLITGQHVANKVHTNLTSFMTMESAVESARRLPMMFHQMRKGHRIKLGGKANTLLGSSFNNLRMRGLLSSTDQINASNVSEFVDEELIEAYNKLGGPEELVEDLRAMQDEFTSIMVRSLEEAAEAGIPLPKGVTAQTYIPHRVAGNISPEKAASFVSDFRQLRAKQLLGNKDAALDLETLDALGWIQITRGAEVAGDGTKLDKKFIIPDDSPFYGMSGKLDDPTEDAIWLRKNVIGKGLKQLEALEPGEGKFASAASARTAAVDLAESPADLLAIKRGEAVARSKDTPRAESAAQNGRSQTVADAVDGLDEQLTVLERGRSELAKLDGVGTKKQQRANKALAKKMDRALAVRRSQLNQMIREATEVGEDLGLRTTVRMAPAERGRVAMDDVSYRGLSDGHSALVDKLDELVAQGIMNDAAKRVIMASFADVDAGKISAMAFTRLDRMDARIMKGKAMIGGGDVNTAIVKLADITGLDIVDGHPARQFAETFIHETAHIAFMSAPPKLQRAFQALYNKVKAGHRSDIVKLFSQHGVDPELALSNVHEFVAYLSQISLVASRTADDALTQTFLGRVKQYFVKLMKGLWLGDEINVSGVADWDMIDKGVRGIFNRLADDSVADDMARKFGVAARVDEYGYEHASMRTSTELDEDIMDLLTAEKAIKVLRDTAADRAGKQSEAREREITALTNSIEKLENLAPGKARPKNSKQRLETMKAELARLQADEGALPASVISDNATEKIRLEELLGEKRSLISRISHMGPVLDDDLDARWLAEHFPAGYANAVRAGEMRLNHLSAIDDLEADIRKTNPDADLTQVRMFLSSLDPRLTSDMTVINRVMDDLAENAAGVYYRTEAGAVTLQKSGLETGLRRSVETTDATGNLKNRNLNDVIIHEITHHVTRSLQKNDRKFGQLQQQLFHSMSFTQRQEFIFEVASAVRGEKATSDGFDGQLISKDEEGMFGLGLAPVADGRTYFNTYNVSYYAETEVEFGNELMALVLEGRMTADKLRQAAEKVMGKAEAKSFISTVTNFITNYLRKANEWVQWNAKAVKEGTLAGTSAQYRILNDMADIAEDFGARLHSGIGLSTKTLDTQMRGMDAVVNAVEALFGRRNGMIQFNENMLGSIHGDFLSLSRPEQVKLINRLMSDASKAKGHQKDMILMAAYKVHDHVHGTNKFFKALEDVEINASEAHPTGGARIRQQIEELNEAIEIGQKALKDVDDPVAEREFAALVDARNELEDSLKKDKGSGDRLPEEAADETPVVRDEDPVIPSVTKAEASKDPKDLMAYVYSKFKARGLSDTRHSNAFNEALIRFFDENDVAAVLAVRSPDEIADQILTEASSIEVRSIKSGVETDIGNKGMEQRVPVLDDEGNHARNAAGEKLYQKVSRRNVSIDQTRTSDSEGLSIRDTREDAVGTEAPINMTEHMEQQDMRVTKLKALLTYLNGDFDGKAIQGDGEVIFTQKQIEQLEAHNALIRVLREEFPAEDPIDIIKRARQRKNNKYTAEANEIADRIAAVSGLTKSNVQRASGKGGPMRMDEIRSLMEEADKISMRDLAEFNSQNYYRKPVVEPEVVDDVIDELPSTQRITELTVSAPSRADKLDNFRSNLTPEDAADPDAAIARAVEEGVDEIDATEAFFDIFPPTGWVQILDRMWRLGFTKSSDEILDMLEGMFNESGGPFKFLTDEFMMPQKGSGVSFASELADLYYAVQRAKGELNGTSARIPAEISGKEIDLPRLSDAELKARWNNDAKARVNRDQQGLGGGQDEATFTGTEGPEAPAPRIDDAGGGEPPVPPKAPAAASPDETPRNTVVLDRLKLRKAERKLLEAGAFNTNHRLADKGTLSELYAMAVRGDDTSIYSPQYVKDMQAEGHTDIDPMSVIGNRYIQHASGGFKAAYRGEASELTTTIGQVSSPQAHFSRTFTDEDLADPEFGEGLAKLLSTSSSPELLLQQYSEMTLGSIRIQQMLKDIFGTEVSVTDLFAAVERSLKQQAASSGISGARGGRSVSRLDGEEIAEYMQELQQTYLRSRGLNPNRAQRKGWGRASRITKNLTYSVLGARFALSVLFVEAPKAIFSHTNLNPVKIAANTGRLGAALIQGAAGQAMTFKPMARFMSNFGIDQRIMSNTLEDMVYEFEAMQASSFSRHGLNGEETATHEAAHNLIDRASRHKSEIFAPGASPMDRLESVTSATADFTGVLSFMTPVTNAVRKVASNQGKEVLIKHLPQLKKLAAVLSELHEGGRFTTKEAIGEARKLGIPRNLAVYASHAGLLADGGKVVDSLSGLIPSGTVRGRDLNMNQIQVLIEQNRQGRREAGLGSSFDEAAADANAAEDKVLPAVNQFMMYFIGEASPELRGGMRVQGNNPLSDLMFSMLTYPMAAYQHIFSNGLAAQGPAKIAGIASGLMVLEYMNRNLQRAMNAKDEAEREEAIRSLTKPKMTDLIDVVGQYGTSSPLFGMLGPYAKDLIGNPLSQAAYNLADVEQKEREKFWRAQPFQSPAMAMASKFVGTTGRFAEAAAKRATSSDDRTRKSFNTAAGNAAKLAVEVSPLNNLVIDQTSRLLSGGGLQDHAKALFSAEKAGLSSRHILPPALENRRAAYGEEGIRDPKPLRQGDLNPAPRFSPETEKAPLESPVTETPKLPPAAPVKKTPSSPGAGLADGLAELD